MIEMWAKKNETSILTRGREHGVSIFHYSFCLLLLLITFIRDWELMPRIKPRIWMSSFIERNQDKLDLVDYTTLWVIFLRISLLFSYVF